MKALIIVDMLQDFVDGALANARAENIIDPLKSLLDHARENGWVVVFSVIGALIPMLPVPEADRSELEELPPQLARIVLGAQLRAARRGSQEVLQKDFEKDVLPLLDGEDDEAASVVKFVNEILRRGLGRRATDIHLEPRRDDAVIRFRIDGILHDIESLPLSVHGAITSRIKVLARMDIAERRRPQDGRIKTHRGDREVELRVSSMATAFGEKVVIRVFDPNDLP